MSLSQEPGHEYTLASINKIHKIHVRDKPLLFYLSTLKLKYIAYLSLQSSVYDEVYGVIYNLGTITHFIGCLLEESLVTF